MTDRSSVEKSFIEVPLKLDYHGLPLVPQPSDDPSDPLNWSYTKKYFILIILIALSFFSIFSFALMSPAYAQVGGALDHSAVEASYIGTVAIAGAAAACFIWAPSANVYGRRPVLLLSQTVALIADFASAFAPTYGKLLAGRLFAGLGHAAAIVLAVLVVDDIFFLHERGLTIGIVTVAVINGPHLAALPGGFVATYISWRWTLILPSIIAAVCWVLIFVGLPETLYVRDEPQASTRDTFLKERKLWDLRPPSRHLRLVDFFRPIQMLKYPPIVAVALYAGVAFTLGGTMPAQSASALFHTYYGWNSAHTGVALGVSTTVGGVLGEFIAGPVTDRLMYAARKKAGGEIKPESRLHAMWPGVFLLPVGLVIFGLMIRFHHLKNSYVGACVAMATTCFAVQVITTPAIAYVVDCYNPQAAETVQLLAFTRQTMAFTVGFWTIPFGDKVGFQWSGLTYAFVTLIFFIPVLITMRCGERIRAALGKPHWGAGV